MADLGPWDPLAHAEVQALFAGADFPWWIAGGWSLDLLVGRQTRAHADTDVTVLRPDLAQVRCHLAEWDIHVADPPGAGSLRPWPQRQALDEGLHDLWCRRREGEPWRLQLMVDDVEGEEWVYRRDRRLRRPIGTLAGRASLPDLPALSPELQLLYKSTSLRPKDQADFEGVLPLLTGVERAWLAGALELTAPGHAWLPRLAGPAA